MQAGLMDAMNFAQAQDGKPYIWGSAGPNGYDCSGYMSAIANVLTGAGNPYKRVFSTGMVTPGVPFGPFVPGPGGPFEIGVHYGNPGHTAGTLNGVNVESTGNHVRYGKDAHGSRDKQFNMLFHIPMENVAAGMSGGPGGSEGMSGVRAIVQQVAATRGWGNGMMWDALDWLISHESSWNPNAQNPTSTAYGLFQFLNSTWAGYGIPKTSDPKLQAEAGMRYIGSRYGNPLGAKAFWQTHHWYDKGGDLMPGMTMAYNGTNMVETVLTNGTTRAVVKALEDANFTYAGFGNILKDMNLPAVTASGFDNPQSNIYNYDISIDGSGLTAKELKTTIKEVIEETHVRKDKKLGLRK
jgi:SLT domain-containing protein